MPGQRIVHSTETVRYAETDQMGITYNAVYPVWFEIGRTDYMAAGGLHYRDIEARGFLLPVSEIYYRLTAPARFGDAITIDTWLIRLESRRVTFGYRIRRDAETLASGWSRLICLTSDFRPTRFPDWIRSAMGPALGESPAMDEAPPLRS